MTGFVIFTGINLGEMNYRNFELILSCRYSLCQTLQGIKLIIRKLFIFVCLTAMTATLCAHDMWTGIKKIESVQVVNDGGFLINLDSEIDVDCLHGGTSTLLISPSENGVTRAGARSLLSTALIAFSTGSNVNIMYSNDTTYCWGKYLLISK